MSNFDNGLNKLNRVKGVIPKSEKIVIPENLEKKCTELKQQCDLSNDPRGVTGRSIVDQSKKSKKPKALKKNEAVQKSKNVAMPSDADLELRKRIMEDLKFFDENQKRVAQSNAVFEKVHKVAEKKKDVDAYQTASKAQATFVDEFSEPKKS